jgi:hypothetical protein
MRLIPVTAFLAGVVFTATPAFAAPQWLRMPVGTLAHEFSRRSVPGKGKPMLPIA